MSIYSINADVVAPKQSENVCINKVRWPELTWEVANKSYVDFKTSSGYTYIPPLHKDDILTQVYIDDADATHKGVVTLTDQTFAGDKYFSGDVYIYQTEPSSSTSVITLNYLEERLGTSGIQCINPIVRTGTDPIIFSINDAQGTSPGAISGGAQTLAGTFTLKGSLVTEGLVTMSGDSLLTGDNTFTGINTFTGTVIAPTNDYTSPDSQVATGDFVRASTLQCGFDGSNGWVSGLDIIAGSASNKYIVSAGAYRFNKYYSTDPSKVDFPKCGPVISHAQFAEQTVSASWGSNYVSVGIFIKNEEDGGNIGKIYEFIGPTSLTEIYGDYIQVGVLVLLGGVIISIANAKLPIAERVSISQIEIAELVAPVNLGPNYIEKHDDPSVDLSLKMSSGGRLWEYGVNAGSDPYNRHEITMAAWDSQHSTSPLWRVWQNNSLVFQLSTDPGASIDTGYYNPGCVGTALSATSSGKWYNSPILYSPAAKLFFQQYPTEEWDTETEALNSPHSFLRMYGQGQSKYLVCFGIITYEGGVTDLTAATIAGGEYFNYQAAGGVGGGSVSGGSGGTAVVEEKYTAWLAAAPCTTTGTMGLITDPFASYSSAVAAAYSATASTRPALIHFTAGYHQTPGPAELKPFVSLSTFAIGAVRFEMNGPSNLIPGAEFATIDNARASVRNMRFVNGSGIDLDLNSIGGTSKSATIDVYDSEVEGGVQFVGRLHTAPDTTSGDVCRFTCCLFHSPCTMDGGNVILNNVQFSTDTLATDELTLQASNCDGVYYIIGSLMRDMSVICTSNYDISVTISSCFFQDNSIITLTQSGTGTLLFKIDRGSVPFPKATRFVYDHTNPLINVYVYDEDDSQENIVYLSMVGNDDQSGVTLNEAVLTLPRAMTLCDSSVSAADPYVINCMDAQIFPAGGTEDITFSNYVSLHAPAATMNGTMTLAAANRVLLKEVNGNVDCSAGDATNPPNSVEIQFLTGAYIRVAESQPPLYAYIGYMNAGDSGTELITVSASNIAYISGNAATGSITATGTGAIIDLTGVKDLRNCTFTAISGGVIRYGPNFGTNPSVSGIIKGTGGGVLAAAVAGTDYIVGTQNLTLQGDVTASGALTSAIDVTIVANAIDTGMLETAPSWSILGRQTGTNGDAAWYTEGSALTLNGVVARDASGNFLVNHAIEGCKYMTFANNTQTLIAADSGLIRVVSGNGTIKFPATTGISTGFSYDIYNAGTGVVNITNSTDGALSTMSASEFSRFVVSTSGSWQVYPYYQTITLGGDVTGTGSQNIDVTIVANAINTGMLETAPSWSILGRQTGTDGDASWYTEGSALTLNGVVARDASGNFLVNHAIEGCKYMTFSSDTQTLLATDSGLIRVVSGSGTIKFPVTTSISTGFSFDVFNAGTGTINVTNSTNGALATMTASDFTRFVVTTAGGWEVYPYYQTITLSGAVTGSGSQNIVTTASPGGTPYTALPDIASPSVLGNISGSTTAPGAVTASALTATANTVVYRDSFGNAKYNHAVEAYASYTANTTFSASHPAYIQFSGGAGATCTLPATSNITSGYKFSIYNSGDNPLILNESGGSAVSTIPSISYADVVWNGSSWETVNLMIYGGPITFTTSLVYNIFTGSQAIVYNGVCSTTDSATWVDLITYDASAIGSTAAFSADYKVTCLNTTSVGDYGMFAGQFRAFYTYGGSLAVKSPLVSSISDLDTGCNACRVQVINSTSTLKLQVAGQASSTNVKWAGQITFVYYTV